MAAEKQEEVLVELLMRVEGSSTLNRVTTFKTPIVGRTEATDDNEPSQIQYETRVLIRRIKEALNRLV